MKAHRSKITQSKMHYVGQFEFLKNADKKIDNSFKMLTIIYRCSVSKTV